jgi:hypothetical protein
MKGSHKPEDLAKQILVKDIKTEAFSKSTIVTSCKQNMQKRAMTSFPCCCCNFTGGANQAESNKIMSNSQNHRVM